MACCANLCLDSCLTIVAASILRENEQGIFHDTGANHSIEAVKKGAFAGFVPDMRSLCSQVQGAEISKAGCVQAYPLMCERSIYGAAQIWSKHRLIINRSRGGHLTFAIVDGHNPAPPKKPWNGDSPVNTNNQ